MSYTVISYDKSIIREVCRLHDFWEVCNIHFWRFMILYVFVCMYFKLSVMAMPFDVVRTYHPLVRVEKLIY